LVEDVLETGAGLSLRAAVEVLAREGPELLQRILVRQARIDFDRDDRGALMFGLEAAHSRRRILHVGNATGRAIMLALLREMTDRPNIRMLTGYTAVDLITFLHHARSLLAVYERPVCHGTYVLDQSRGQGAADRRPDRATERRADRAGRGPGGSAQSGQQRLPLSGRCPRDTHGLAARRGRPAGFPSASRLMPEGTGGQQNG
jgi:hypothetical protein